MATQAEQQQQNSISSSESNEQQQQQQMMDIIRKRKRMQSNRESARRSRQRKQKHLDDLTNQVGQLQAQNAQISTTIDTTAQLYVNIEAQNSVLRAQLAELNNRLLSLNDITQYFLRPYSAVSPAATTTTTTTNNSCGSDLEGLCGFDFEFDDGFSMEEWSVVPFVGHDPHVMPALDVFLCS